MLNRGIFRDEMFEDKIFGNLHPAWRQYIEMGNQKTKMGLYDEGIMLYREALSVAEQLLSDAVATLTKFDTIHLFVVTCHDLAENYIHLRLKTEAEMFLQMGYEQSRTLMQSNEIPLRFRAEAFQAFQVAFLQLIDFYTQTNQKQEREAVIWQSKWLMQDFLEERSLCQQSPQDYN